MIDDFYYMSQEHVDKFCHPQPTCACPFLTRVDGLPVCVRNTAYEEIQRTQRAKIGLPTNTGNCTGYPVFLDSIEDDTESNTTLRFNFNIEGTEFGLTLTYFSYLYMVEKAGEAKTDINTYLYRVAKAGLDKFKE